MVSKKVLNVLIILLIASLTCAAIYAVETTGEVSHDNTTDKPSGLYISGSGEVSHVMGSVNPVHSEHVPVSTVYV